MTARPLTLLATALAGGMLLAGCGGSSKSSSQSTTTATTPAAASTSTTPTSTSATGLTGSALQQAIAQCRAAVQGNKVLPADAKSKVEAVCPNLAKGETAPVKRVAEEVCTKIIKGSAIPAGPSRERALAACSKVK